MKSLLLTLVCLSVFALIFVRGNLFEPDSAPSSPMGGLQSEPGSEDVNLEEDAPELTPPSASSPASPPQETAGLHDIQREPQYEEQFRQRVRELREKIPSIEEVRDEVSKNPHGTPASYTDFAGQLAPLMEQALRNKEQGRDLFEELEFCALPNASIPDPIRSICFHNMKRLSEAHPEELAEAFQQAQQKADPEQDDFNKFMER